MPHPEGPELVAPAAGSVKPEGLQLESRVEAKLFRPAALEHHRRRPDDEGRLLRVTPSWLDRLYQLLMAAAVVACCLLLLVPANEYASGPAVVRLGTESEVRAGVSGVVEEVLVTPGSRVEEGQVLARLEGARQRAELDRLRRQFELQLVDRLRAPRLGAQGGLGASHEDMRLAERDLERLELRAPHAGAVGDVLVRPGKPVDPGQLAFTVVSDAHRGEPRVIGLLPGRFRPLLAPGMPLRLRWSGYGTASEKLIIDHVSSKVVGSGEVRALAGAIATDALGASDGLTLVEAHLTATTFEAAGRQVEVSDGLVGFAEVPVRKRRLASLLLPWLDEPVEVR